MSSLKRLAACSGILVATWANPGWSIPITIINDDPSGIGLNDPTPSEPVGGNTATTLGGQRIAVLNRGAELVGRLIDGPVPIEVRTITSPSLFCNATRATLASAGATFLIQDFVNAPEPQTYYPIGLANQFVGRDLIPADNSRGDEPSDISLRLNRDIGSAECLEASSVYYGLDDQAPPATVNLLATIVHELIHGLGFSSAVNPETGVFDLGNPAVFDRLIDIQDSSGGVTAFDQATPAERLMAATSGEIGSLFIGSDRARRGKQSRLVNQGREAIGPALYSPNPVESGSSISHWSQAFVPNQTMEPLISFDLQANQGIGLSSCVLADMGWQISDPTVCPGAVDAAAVTLSRSRVDFGIVPPSQFAQTRVRIYSTSGDPVEINGLSITGSNAFAAIDGRGCQQVDLNQVCSTLIRFDPAPGTGRTEATLTVRYANQQEVTATLVGAGATQAEEAAGQPTPVPDDDGEESAPVVDPPSSPEPSDESPDEQEPSSDDTPSNEQPDPNQPETDQPGDEQKDPEPTGKDSEPAAPEADPPTDEREENAPADDEGDTPEPETDSPGEEGGESVPDDQQPDSTEPGGMQSPDDAPNDETVSVGAAVGNEGDDGTSGSAGGGCSMASTSQPFDPTLLALCSMAGVLVIRRKRRPARARP